MAIDVLTGPEVVLAEAEQLADALIEAGGGGPDVWPVGMPATSGPSACQRGPLKAVIDAAGRTVTVRQIADEPAGFTALATWM